MTTKLMDLYRSYMQIRLSRMLDTVFAIRYPLLHDGHSEGLLCHRIFFPWHTNFRQTGRHRNGRVSAIHF